MPNSDRLIPHRIVIYAKDIRNITGRSERTARKMLQQIRIATGKKKGDFITVAEFCGYTGLQEETISKFLAY